MTKTEIRHGMERGADGIKCTCGGYADKVDTTHDEDAAYGCGRRSCCAVAFKCAVCGTRIVGSQVAPEME